MTEYVLVVDVGEAFRCPASNSLDYAMEFFFLKWKQLGWIVIIGTCLLWSSH